MTHPGTQPYVSRGARFASYSGPYRTQIGPPHLARITRPGPSICIPPVVFRAGLQVLGGSEGEHSPSKKGA